MTVADNNNEKEFFVKDIPEHFTDWDLFRVFLKYGSVDNVRIPSSQSSGQSKYGFVTMLSLNGSDAIRKNINKRKLAVSDNISIWVSDIRVNGSDKTNSKKPDRILAPISQNISSAPRAKQTDEEKGRSLPESYVAYRDLPVGEFIEANIVPSPHDGDKEFSFHVVEVGASKKDYDDLSDGLRHYCSSNTNLRSRNEVKVGGFLIYAHEKAYYRAKRLSETEVYLVDIGVLLPFSYKNAWRMFPLACTLPALVVPCSIANVKWVRTTPEAITAVRNVLIEWFSAQGTVRVQNTGFKKSLNVVNIYKRSGSGDNLIDLLVKSGYCNLSSEEPSVKTYSRAELLTFKSAVEETKCDDIARIQEQFKKFEISKDLTAETH